MRAAAASRYGCVAAIAGLLLGLMVTMLPVAVRAQGTTSRSADDPMAAALRINVYICLSPTASVTSWRQTISGAIARAISSPPGVRGRIMGEAQCGAESVEFACRAGVYDQAGRVLNCSPDTLLQLIRVAGWYALQHSASENEDYEAFRMRQPSPLTPKAFAASAASRSDADFEAGLARLQAEAEAAGGQPSSQTGQVFQAILNLTLAAVFGHEASHVETEAPYCAITNPSRVEQSGLWAVLLRVATSDELYKPESLVTDEVRADRCATRRIRLEVGALAAGTLTANEQAFARRAAADIVSAILLSHEVNASGRQVFRIVDGYLYPPMRIMALAGEMSDGQSGSMVCGGAAENLVEAAQQTFRAVPGNGIMPDEMEHTLPRGVVAAWERRTAWSPASFACR